MESNLTSCYFLDCHFSPAAVLFGKKKWERASGNCEEKKKLSLLSQGYLVHFEISTFGNLRKGSVKVCDFPHPFF